jgi:multiple sugar transport system ATP-binding protein
MPELSFQRVSKSYGTVSVIDAFSATINDGEFLVLLGPSGCGKSTLLRMIAGLTNVTSGEIQFDGAVANEWEPSRRRVAFVFQSYALYPHMTVRSNIAFPLMMAAFKKWHHLPIVNTIMRRRLMNSPEIAQPTARIAEQLELGALLDRRPANLSGGQRQRVALARALVRDPSLYLFDEPLSNLDAKLRTQMRSELTTLHNKVGKTFIYVTHDQVEAMTMATRIIIMDRGVVQQVDTPEEIYNKPSNTFVARFIGAPPMNLLPVTRQGAHQLEAANAVKWKHEGLVPDRRNLILGIRPEKMEYLPEGQGQIPAQIAIVERLGAETIVGCRLSAGSARQESRLLEQDLVFVRMQGNMTAQVGRACSLGYKPGDATWFDAETGNRIDELDR